MQIIERLRTIPSSDFKRDDFLALIASYRVMVSLDGGESEYIHLPMSWVVGTHGGETSDAIGVGITLREYSKPLLALTACQRTEEDDWLLPHARYPFFVEQPCEIQFHLELNDGKALVFSFQFLPDKVYRDMQIVSGARL